METIMNNKQEAIVKLNKAEIGRISAVLHGEAERDSEAGYKNLSNYTKELGDILENLYKKMQGIKEGGK